MTWCCSTTVFFLEVLPRLPRGVTVVVHDIFLPYDYPGHWRRKYYSEQYLLAAHLLAARDLKVRLASFHVSDNAGLMDVLGTLPGLWGPLRPTSFWFYSEGTGD